MTVARTHGRKDSIQGPKKNCASLYGSEKKTSLYELHFILYLLYSLSVVSSWKFRQHLMEHPAARPLHIPRLCDAGPGRPPHLAGGARPFPNLPPGEPRPVPRPPPMTGGDRRHLFRPPTTLMEPQIPLLEFDFILLLPSLSCYFFVFVKLSAHVLVEVTGGSRFIGVVFSVQLLDPNDHNFHERLYVFV